jgi:hypothetical protein
MVTNRLAEQTRRSNGIPILDTESSLLLLCVSVCIFWGRWWLLGMS